MKYHENTRVYKVLIKSSEFRILLGIHSNLYDIIRLNRKIGKFVFSSLSVKPIWLEARIMMKRGYLHITYSVQEINQESKDKRDML